MDQVRPAYNFKARRQLMQKAMEYVLIVAEERSFSKAAERLFVSQPALSAMIKKEEGRLGLPLFDRSETPIKLTQAGKYYLEAAKEIAAVETAFSQKLDTLRFRQNDVLTIGSSAFFCAHILPALVQKFKAKYPAYAVETVEGSGRELIQDLHAGKLNFIVEVERYDSNLYDNVPLQEEEIILAVPAKYTNKKLSHYVLTYDSIVNGSFRDPQRPAVDLKNFGAVPFILLKKGNDLYDRAVKMFYNAGIEPPVAMYLDQVQTSYFVAKDGNGATFIRANLLNFLEPTDKLLFYKLADPAAKRYVRIFCKKKDHSKIEQVFWKFCQQNIHSEA